MVTETLKGPDRRFLVLLENSTDNEEESSDKGAAAATENITGFDDTERTLDGLTRKATAEGGVASGRTKLVLPKDFKERKKLLTEALEKETSSMKICEKIGVIKDSVKEIVKEAYLKSRELARISKVEEYTVMPLVDQRPEATEYEVQPGQMIDYLHLENSVRREINTIKRRLLDIVIDEMAPRWVPGANRGKRIDRRLIARAELGQEDFFKYKLETDILNVAFFLLIDESGSMYGEKAKQARRCGVMFGKILSSINVPHMIAGFSTCALTSEQVVKAQKDIKFSQCEGKVYSRTDNLMHNIYKRFDESYDKVKTKLVNIAARANNYDQDHVEWAWQHLQKYCLMHNIERKVLIVISDGQPCYSMDTEVLTEAGFKLYHDITVQDKIACFNPTTETLEYHPYIDRWLKQFTGDMVHFQTDKMDIMVTPDHNMLVQSMRAKQKEWKTKAAQKIRGGGGWRFRSVVNWKGQKPPKFVQVGDKQISLIDYLQLIGYYVSEGSVRYLSPYKKEVLNSVRIYQNQFRKGIEQSSFHKMKNDLLKLPYNIVLNKDQNNNRYGNVWPNGKGGTKYFSITNLDLAKHLISEFGLGSYNKKISSFIKNLPAEYIKIFLEAALLGDGYHQTSWKNKVKRYYYITTSPQLRDDIQELAFKAGYAPIAKIHHKAKQYGDCVTCYHVTWSDSNVGRFPIVDGRGKTGAAIHKVPYQGDVFCFTVPHHLFVTRHNGHITIQGNCGGAGAREKLIRVINEIGCDANAEVIGIGIKTQYVKDFYHKCIEIDDVCELGGNVVKLLESAIKKGRRKW